MDFGCVNTSAAKCGFIIAKHAIKIVNNLRSKLRRFSRGTEEFGILLAGFNITNKAHDDNRLFFSLESVNGINIAGYAFKLASLCNLLANQSYLSCIEAYNSDFGFRGNTGSVI